MLLCNKSWIRAASVTTLALVAVACGSSDSNLQAPAPVAPVNQPVQAPVGANTPYTCGGGGYNIRGQCVYGSSFQQACWMAGGTMVNSTLCKTVDNYSGVGFTVQNNSQYQLGLVSPANPAGTNAFYPYQLMGYGQYITVRPGDKILVAGVSGGWGATSSKVYNFLIGSFTTWSLNCSEIRYDGTAKDGSAVSFSGYPAALYASDGTEAFKVTAGLSKVINYSGDLRFGFNAPTDQTTCSKATLSFSLTHCQDAGGTTYPCQ